MKREEEKDRGREKGMRDEGWREEGSETDRTDRERKRCSYVLLP